MHQGVSNGIGDEPCSGILRHGTSAASKYQGEAPEYTNRMTWLMGVICTIVWKVILKVLWKILWKALWKELEEVSLPGTPWAML